MRKIARNRGSVGFPENRKGWKPFGARRERRDSKNVERGPISRNGREENHSKLERRTTMPGNRKGDSN